MFKKDPQTKPSANIKSSERRKLLGSICQFYKLQPEELSKDEELRLMPAITKQSTFKSIQGHSGTIYLDENEIPTWFKSRDSQLYPSVFTAWRNPRLLPLVRTHPHVIEVLANGADLMLPGTIPPFDQRVQKNVVVGVVDSASPGVVKAIGICKLDLRNVSSVLGKSGVAVEILHVIGDTLYNLNKQVEIAIPKEIIVTDEGQHNGEDEEKISSNLSEVIKPEEAPEENARNNLENSAEVLSELPQDLIDNFFIKAALQAIYLNNIELPVSSSNFMSTYVYKNLPVMDLQYCNIKRTSWKKSAKFLKALEKRGYLECKGKNDNISITSLTSRDNLIFANFVPHKTVGSKLKPSSPQVTKSQKKDKSNELQVLQVYKPTSKTRAIFNELDEDFSKCYSASSLKSILEFYCKKKELVNKKNPREIVLNDTLRGATNLSSGSYPRDTLFKAFLGNFTKLYKIVRPGESPDLKDLVLHKGEPPQIKIITEMKIGRKVVTKVLNFETFYINAQTLAGELKVKCSGSSTIQPSINNPKITEVTVQGPHGKLIIGLLKQKGVPTSNIIFEDKTKKKKSK